MTVSTALAYRCLCGLEQGHHGPCVKAEDWPRTEKEVRALLDQRALEAASE